MVKCWLFLFYAVAFVGVNANDLSDFSNNLATDIGPLLILLGDSMTRQYLSESTSFLDYFIFAMAPIGILTAIVSAIRVCGTSSLRAFIGRSQEGDGVVEAELCTSTSRDVCELFNKGGITRVLGRPNILELVHVPYCGSQDANNPSPRPDKAGLFLFRHYLETHHEADASGWTEDRDSMFGRSNAREGRPPPFAPKPNLSLNVGIKKQPDWVFYTAAAIGFVLQAGVLALAGVGVWILRWNLNNAETPASRDYAPIMFIAGTILMCGGMWSCAALIGETTHELRYKRKRESAEQSRLIWLQPGPQVIGDQSFDPFAYFDMEDDPLLHWTSSKKNLDEKFGVHTSTAVSVVLVGYIMQFIGLRGMKAWVSLAQLGITVVMSILRGLLRMQRLGRDDNRLAKMPDLVVGHELDWLAFEIAWEKSQKGSFWHVTGQHEKAEVEAQNNGSTNVSQPHRLSRTDKALGGSSKLGLTSSPRAPASSGRDKDSLVNVEDLLRVRLRLSHLTGHISFSTAEDSACQYWKDDYVRVRTSSRKLSAALCQASKDLFQKILPENDIVLRITAATSLDLEDRLAQAISVTLKPPPHGSAQASWSIDSAQLEAILGLWMWSFVSDERLATEEDSGNMKSRAGTVEVVRIVSAGTNDKSWNEKPSRQAEMDLWLGPNAVMLSEATLTVDNRDHYGLVDLWTRSPAPKTDWRMVPVQLHSNRSKSYPSLKSYSRFLREKVPADPTSIRNSSPGEKQWEQLRSGQLPLRRFCGWNVAHELLRPWVSDSTVAASRPSKELTQAKLRVRFFPTNGSLLDICTQELFTALTSSLLGLLSIGKVAIVENNRNVQLYNPTVATLAKAFVENGLGSHFDALSCIIPAFGNQLRSDPEAMISAIIRGAKTYRQEAEWERAEIILRWACQHYFPPHGGEGKSPSMLIGNSFGRTLRATGELYRWSLAQRSDGKRQEFGRRGIEWMTKSYSSVGQSNQDIKDILDCYRQIAERTVEDRAAKDSVQDTVGTQRTGRTQHPLRQAIWDRNRMITLYHLCFITTGDFGSEYLQAALPLAVRNNWNEVVDAILEMKGNPNSQDEDGRTAVSYCAELGFESYLKPLIDLGTFLDLPDNDQRTPLLWAANTGHTDIARTLLDTGHVDCNRQDTNGQTPLSYAVENGHGFTVELLLGNGANIEAKDNSTRAPLLRAAQNGNEAMVQLLLDKGANTESVDHDGRTPLSHAAENGQEVIVRLLLSKDANVEAKGDYSRTPTTLMNKVGGSKPPSASTENRDAAVVQLLPHKSATAEAESDCSRTPLLWAAQTGHEGIAQLLLDKGANVEAKDGQGRTPLSWASQNGSEATVQLLLNKGANIESTDRGSGRKPLSHAVENGHEAVVRLLLCKGAIVDAIDGHGRTPLSYAAEVGNEAVAQRLLNEGANLEANGGHGRTALSYAAESGHEAIVQLLLGKGATVEATENYLWSPLSYAAGSGYIAIVQQLLDKGANVESGCDSDRTPLTCAAKSGHEAIVRLLLDKGANTERNRFGRTALSYASENGHEAVVCLLLGRGATVETPDYLGRTPLSYAAESGNTAIIQQLLEKGADVEGTDRSRKTGWGSSDGCDRPPLSYAAGNGHEAAVRLLLTKGANIEATGINGSTTGRTPLSYAAENGREAVVQRLLDEGAIVDREDLNDWTPLSWATRNGHEVIVQLLLDKGANVEAADSYDRTPLSWASQKGNEAIVQLLLGKGANVEAMDSNCMTPLSHAAKNGHEAAVRLLLDKDAIVETIDSYGLTPSLLAAKNGHEAVVLLLKTRMDGQRTGHPLSSATRTSKRNPSTIRLQTVSQSM